MGAGIAAWLIDTRAGGVEETDCLVRQLAGRDIAMRQGHGRADRLVTHDHAVMPRERFRKSAHHVDRRQFFRLRHLQNLETPRECGILFNVPFVFRPGRRADRANRAARERGLEQIGGVAGAGLAARTDQRVDFVDEQDHGDR
jgi:hypothetical protein